MTGWRGRMAPVPSVCLNEPTTTERSTLRLFSIPSSIADNSLPRGSHGATLWEYHDPQFLRATRENDVAPRAETTWQISDDSEFTPQSRNGKQRGKCHSTAEKSDQLTSPLLNNGHLLFLTIQSIHCKFWEFETTFSLLQNIIKLYRKKRRLSREHRSMNTNIYINVTTLALRTNKQLFIQLKKKTASRSK